MQYNYRNPLTTSQLHDSRLSQSVFLRIAHGPRQAAPNARSGIPSCELAYPGTWLKLEPEATGAIQEHCWEAGSNCPMGCVGAETIHAFYGKGESR